MKRIWLCVALIALLSAGAAWAQEWKGKATLSGAVTDTAGKPINGAVVTLVLGNLNAGPKPTKTNNKGLWEVKNLADGKWIVRISREGFDAQEFTIDVGGQAKNPAIQVRLAPAGTNAELASGDEKAKVLLDQKKYAEARTMYQDLLTKYPQATRIHIMVAQTYDSEGKFSEAADELSKYLESNPQNVDVGLVLANEYAKAGRGEEAFKLMSTVPVERMKTSDDLQQCGFQLLRVKKPVDALKFFELALKLFPNEVTNLYYRGISEVQIGAIVEKPGTPQSREHFDRAAEDLKKFVSLAPNSPEAANVPKLLEQIK